MTYPQDAVGGQRGLYGIVDAGPTFGRIRRPIFPDRYITDATASVEPFDFQLLVSRNGIVIITLPSVTNWARQHYGGFPIIIKDKGGFCSETNYIRALAVGSDLIDGQASMDLINAYAAMTIRYYDDLSGWYVT